MYVNLDKNFLDKNMKKMEKNAKEVFGDEDGKDQLVLETIESTISDIEFDDGNLTIGVDSDMGYFSIDVDIDDELAFDIIDHMKKKGEKIKRLVNFAE